LELCGVNLDALFFLIDYPNVEKIITPLNLYNFYNFINNIFEQNNKKWKEKKCFLFFESKFLF